MRYVLLLVVFLCMLSACKTTSFVSSSKNFSQHIQSSPNYEKTLVGVAIYDMDKKEYIVQHNANKYFIPASTTKLFTFYAGLKILGSRPTTQIPALQYLIRRDSIILFGTGNPTLLHPEFASPIILDFLKSRNEKIYLSDTNWKDAHFGEGWSWDDYNEYYATEKSALPIYGNYATFSANSEKQIFAVPVAFKSFLREDTRLGDGLIVQRKISSNDFSYSLKKVDKPQMQEVPFVTSTELAAKLLSDTLKKEVRYISYPYKKAELSTLLGFQADSLYRRMLQPSDNFLAEQIMLMCSSQLGEGKLNVQLAIEYMLKNHLNDLTDTPRWVDGSGLSRMNLFSPRSQVELLLKMYKEVATDQEGEQRLFNLLAIGGKAGTIRNLFKNYPPFVFAKTGSLGNTACLSGYLITRSGKRLTFAFMNNHFMQPISAVRAEMERILTEFYLKY